MTKNKNTKILIFVFLILTPLTQQAKVNYQKRQLYYNSEDYVCHSGYPLRKDIILLILGFEDSSSKSYYADGGTICNDRTTQPWNEVQAVKSWSYYERSQDYTVLTQIKFNQTVTTEYTKFPRRTKSIIASSTINNPTIIENVSYDCQIDGNEMILHYGIYERNADPCRFYIKCKERKEVAQQ